MGEKKFIEVKSLDEERFNKIAPQVVDLINASYNSNIEKANFKLTPDQVAYLVLPSEEELAKALEQVSALFSLRLRLEKD